MAGVITDNGGALPSPTPPATPTLVVTPDMETNLNGDPKVEPFTDADSGTTSTLRVVATERSGTTTNVAYIYDPVDVVNPPSPPPSPPYISNPTWTNQNLYTLVRVGSYLYTIDYDRGIVIEVNGTAPYAETGVSYTFTPPTGWKGCGQALIVVGNTLYGLFACPDSTWSSYTNSRLVRFTINPGVSITAPNVSDINANLEQNAFAIASDGTSFYIASIGGPQGSSGQGNPNSKLQSLPTTFTNRTPASSVLVPSQLPSGAVKSLEFRDVSLDGSGNFYIFVGTYNASWNMDGFIYRAALATPTTLTQFAAVSNVPGYFWSAQYTPDNDRVWFAHGNDIYVYDATNYLTSIGILHMSDLISTGGIAYDSLNDLCFIGTDTGTRVRLSGYKSPLQVSKTPLAVALRAITQGRPEATEEEIAQAQASLKA
jgi:hypothetical protein